MKGPVDGPHSSLTHETGFQYKKKSEKDNGVCFTNSVFLKMLHFTPCLIHVILKIIMYSNFLATPQEIAHFQKLKPNNTPMHEFKLCPRKHNNYTLLRYYAESSANSLQKFRNNLSVPSSRAKNFILVDGTDRLSEHISKEMPLLAA
jgi:hypothetical protein